MSKVVHLSEQAHTKAKVFCKSNRIRMSDWVAALIEEAISLNRTDLRQGAVGKKRLEPLDHRPQTTNDGQPVYAAPPFWVSKAS